MGIIFTTSIHIMQHQGSAQTCVANTMQKIHAFETYGGTLHVYIMECVHEPSTEYRMIAMMNPALRNQHTCVENVFL